MKEKKENGKLKLFILIFRIISLIIIAICVYILYLWHLDNSQNKSIQENLENKYIKVTINHEQNSDEFSPIYTESVDENGLSLEQFQVDFDALIEQNSDTVAWVRVPDTNISYPIVQSSDNSFYLNKNFDKQKNGAGWIFADYRNNFEKLDKNTIIYGHNRRNGTMFSNLRYYLDEEFCADINHKFINFNTKNSAYLAEIFSVYKISSNNVDLPNNFTTITQLEDKLNEWKSNSIYDFQTDVTTSDNLLSLYTCDNNTTYRILIHAKLIPLD